MVTTRQSELVGYLVKCKECEEDNLVTAKHAYIYRDSSECDMCGSHGYVRLDTDGETCANCSAKLGEVTVDEW